MLSSILKGSQGNSLGLQNLTIEMEKSNTSLENIQLLLKGQSISKINKQDHSRELEVECQQKTLELEKKEKEILEKDEFLLQAQQRGIELKQALDLQAEKHKREIAYWQKQHNDEQNKFLKLEENYDKLIQKNYKLESMTEKLKQAYELEIREKEREILEKERDILEKEREIRDKELEIEEKEEEFQQNLKCVQREKVNESLTLENKIEELEIENEQYKKRIDILEAMSSNINNNQDNKNKNNLSQNESIDEKDKLNKIRKKSRIPVLSPGSIQKQLDLKREMDLMKDDLLLFQDKLIEKISQNKQLESAIERMNEHCQILRNSLNETREESADRYRKMMKYMQENTLLKEELDNL